jgi:hypothetical protein
MDEMITSDGEIVTGLPALTDTAGLSAIVRAEIDVQITTARLYPRSLKRVMNNITTLATMDETTAEECLYALVRGGKKKPGQTDSNNKPIEGPSIRLAEIAAQCYGNCRIEARVVQVNRTEKYVEAVGIFHDLETNMASSATVRRRISTRENRIFSDDMIIVTGNAACSIAKRNAILAGIPRGVYRAAYLAARDVVAGTASAISVNRDKAIKAFAAYGVTPEQIFEKLSVEDETDISREHIVTLRGMFSTIKNGESSVEEMFGKEKSGPDHEVIKDPLSDKVADSASSGSANPPGQQTDAPAGDGSLDQSSAGATTTERDEFDDEDEFSGVSSSTSKKGKK